MSQQLEGKRVAILATDGFEESELAVPQSTLRGDGVEVHVIAPNKDGIRAWNRGEWSKTYDVDVALDQAKAADYHALVLPGGVINPDKLRVNETALEFVNAFFQAGKPVAAICHGPWTLINAGVVEGRKMTSYPSVRKDLENAGALWEDSEVVVDQGLVTSRKPDDLDAFCKRLAEELAEGRHEGQHA